MLTGASSLVAPPHSLLNLQRKHSTTHTRTAHDDKRQPAREQPFSKVHAEIYEPHDVRYVFLRGMSLLRWAAVALPFAGVGAAAAWCLSSDAPSQRAASLYLIPLRLSRDVIAASSILGGASRAPCSSSSASLTHINATCPGYAPPPAMHARPSSLA